MRLRNKLKMEQNYNSKSIMELKSIYRTLRSKLLGCVDKELEGNIKEIDKGRLISLIKIHNMAVCATEK